MNESLENRSFILEINVFDFVEELTQFVNDLESDAKTLEKLAISEKNYQKFVKAYNVNYSYFLKSLDEDDFSISLQGNLNKNNLLENLEIEYFDNDEKVISIELNLSNQNEASIDIAEIKEELSDATRREEERKAYYEEEY